MKSAQIHAMFIDCVWRTKLLASSPGKSIHPVRMISINTGIEFSTQWTNLRLTTSAIHLNTHSIKVYFSQQSQLSRWIMGRHKAGSSRWSICVWLFADFRWHRVLYSECFQLAQELRLRNPTIQCQWTIPGLQYSEKENGIGFSRRDHCILRGNAGFLARDFLGSRRRTLEDIKLREKQNCVWVYESRFTCYFVRAWLLRRLCRFPCLWVI